ncbi:MULTISPECIES: hypothetical protein [Streptomyces]|uniref:Integral membrane protein n=1 Tax=Streptomyces sp. NBC_00093 TaxID=2975649 RepID=A0AAU1ZTR5_9ACTN
MSTTGRDLTRRLRLLLALGAAATLVLFGAYRGVHDDTVPLASSSAPGILAVDTATNALRNANKVVSGGVANDTTGEFHTQISVAHQNLALAASENVTGFKDRHTLRTVTGLIAVYSGFVERSGKEPDNRLLSTVYLHYANQVLVGDIMSRLEDLRAEQVKEAKRQASFPWQLRLGWSAVLVLYAALCAALVEAQWFARRRFRHSVHPPLLAATVLCVAGVAVLGWLTLEARTAMTRALAELLEPKGAKTIPLVAGRVEENMANAGLWASLSNWVLIEGALLMALMVAGLWPRIAEYRFRAAR